ncbi:unnamed protein product, partial [marine sediment metagenome]
DSVVVAFTVGYGLTPADIPAGLQEALVLIAKQHFEPTDKLWQLDDQGIDRLLTRWTLPDEFDTYDT